ncbi:MAG: ROK family transcriptional regulator [Anaerolineae bacterium]|nr:ROK family transcriptional regulator [Anaerolineae bacterium]
MVCYLYQLFLFVDKLTMPTLFAAPNLEASKYLTRRLVLEQILVQRRATRAEIVQTTGLSKSAVSSIVGELIDAGLVREGGNENPSVGRPRILLELVPESRLVLGAEIDEDACRVVLMNLCGEMVAQVALSVKDTTAPEMLKVLEEGVNQVVAGADPTRVLGLGVAIPAYVDLSSGEVIYSVVLKWNNVPLRQELAQRFPWPVAVVGRGHAAAWGEASCGIGQGVSSLLYARIGSFIGTGLVLGGRLYTGDIFLAGDLGHVTVQADGTLCWCGNRGCLATVATTGFFLSRTRQLLRTAPTDSLWEGTQGSLERITLSMSIEAARDGSPVARQVLAEVGQWLGVASASVVNLLNLNKIIIGGPLAQAGDLLLEPLREELKRRALPLQAAQAQVVLSALHENAPALGAANLILHDLATPAQASATLHLPTSNRLFERRQ